MTTATKVGERYMELIRRFPLRPIRSREELGRAVEVANELAILDRRARDEDDYLDILTDVIEAYEDVHYPIKPLPEGVMLCELMAFRGETQVELEEATGVAQSTISAIIRGKREMTRRQVAKFAAHFHVDPAVFAGPPVEDE